MTKPNPLTRKAGPLPVWAWAALAFAAWFLFLRGGGTASATLAGPQVGPAATGSSAAQAPASGQGSAADNANSDLLAALGANASSLDTLLATLQGAGGGAGVAGSGSGTSGAAAASAFAATPAADPTPIDSSATTSAAPAPGETTPSGSTYDPATGAWLIPTPGALSRSSVLPAYVTPPDAQVGNVIFGGQFDTPTAQVSGPTPYAVVTPAPVDTTSATVAPTDRPTVGKPVMV